MQRNFSFDRHIEDDPYEEEFLHIMMFPDGNLERSRALMSKFQINGFIKSMQLGNHSVKEKRRTFVKIRKTSKSKKPTTNYSGPIFTSMLRLGDKLEEIAVKIFSEIIRYMGLEEGKPLDKEESIALIVRLYAFLHKYPQLRDETFAQLEKQTRNNPYKGSCLKAWELMRFCAAAYPPSKSMIVHLSEYFVYLTKDENSNAYYRDFVLSSWSYLDRAIKGGCRKTQPAAEEIEAMMSSRKMTTSIFFYDDVAEEIAYDVTTTTSEALKDLFSRLKLQNTSSLCLFECRTMTQPGSNNEEPTIEHVRLEGSRFIGDVISDFRASGWGGYVSCRLLLKRRIFRITEEGITESIFMHLSFLQLKHDYLAGYYWVPSDLAAQIAALLIVAKLGFSGASVMSEQWMEQLKLNWPARLRPRANVDFRTDVLARCRTLGPITKDDAKQQIVRTILALPGGGSIFFAAKKALDSSDCFPDRVIVGVSSRGIQFLNISTHDLVHSASLREIEEYAANHERVYFRLMIKGRLHAVEFDTNQGSEISSLLDIHIKDALRVQSKGSSPNSN